MKDLLVKLKLKNENYNKGLKDSADKTKGFSSSVSTSMKGAIASFVAVTASVDQIKKGLTDLAQETRGIAKVNAVIKATGGAAGITAKDIEKWTAEMQKSTEFSQDNAREAAALGLTFKNISKNIFPEVLSLSADMASIVGTDLKGAMMQLSKAIDNPAKQFTALRRSGVSFSKEQENMIKTMQGSGNIAGAQAVLMKALREQIGGAAQAVGKTWIGTVTRAQNAFADLRKEFLKGFFEGGSLGILDDFIKNQDKIKAWVRNFAYNLTHNTILTEFKALFKEIGVFIQLAMKGWSMLWETAIKPVLSQALKGWKLIAAVATTALRNIRYIFMNIGDIAVDVFNVATLQIELMITKATAKIKPLLSFVQTYLQTGSFKRAQSMSGAESKLSESNVYRANRNLANYELQSGDISAALSRNMENLGIRINEIMTESLLVQMPQKQEEAKQDIITTNAEVKENTITTNAEVKEAIATAVIHWQDNAMNAYKLAKEQADKEAKAQAEWRAQMLSVTANVLNGMNNAINVWASTSLNTFGKIMGTAGGFSSLFDLAIPGLGSVVSAGTGLLTNLFGQADDNSSTSSTDSSTTAISDAAMRPSASITKTADTINYYNYNTYEIGAMTGDQQTMYELAQIVTSHQRNIMGASA